MDSADATLGMLAARIRIPAVCTLDQRGFRAYRSGLRKTFDLVLDRGTNA